MRVIEEVRKAALTDLADRDEDEPCMGVHAVSLLDALNFDADEVNAHWRKLQKRPCGAVRKFAQDAKKQSPESRRYSITEFGRTVKPVV